MGAAGKAALQLHRESGKSWDVPALGAAAAPLQGHFQSLGLPQATSIKTLWGSLGYVVHLQNVAAVIRVRGDEHPAGSDHEKGVIPSAAPPPFVAPDLSGSQKRALNSLHSHLKASQPWLAGVVHVRQNLVCSSDSLRKEE